MGIVETRRCRILTRTHLDDYKMYDKFLSFAVLGALVLTCSGDSDERKYDNPFLTHDVQAKSGDYQFFFHNQNDLLLTVTRDACYYSVLGTNEQGMLKYEPLEAEARIMKSISTSKNVQPTTLLTNFHCVGRRVYTLDAKNAMKRDGSDESDSSD